MISEQRLTDKVNELRGRAAKWGDPVVASRAALFKELLATWREGFAEGEVEGAREVQARRDAEEDIVRDAMRAELARDREAFGQMPQQHCHECKSLSANGKCGKRADLPNVYAFSRKPEGGAPSWCPRMP